MTPSVGVYATLVVTFGGLTVETYFYQETDVWQHPILSRFVPPHVLQPRSVRRTKAPDADYHHIPVAAAAGDLARQGVLVTIGAGTTNAVQVRMVRNGSKLSY